MTNIPWPPPSAAAWHSLHALRRSPFLRHVADLYWTSHLPEHERDAVLDHMTLYDLRHGPNARHAELARLRRLDRAAELLDELRDLLDTTPPHIETPSIHAPRIHAPNNWKEAA